MLRLSYWEANMFVSARDPADLDRLGLAIRQSRSAEQRDRLRVALLAIEGQETSLIMDKLGRSRGFVQRWAYAYRDGGIPALAAKKRGGSRPRLSPQEEERFAQRIRAGATEADGVCTLRGKDAQRILAQEFGQSYSLGGAIDLLHRLGFACLRPRPRHRKNDPAAMTRWLNQAPLLSKD
jgi:transposase